MLFEPAQTVSPAQEECQLWTYFAALAVHNHLNAIHKQISPINVPAARIANPSPNPQTNPQMIPITEHRTSVQHHCQQVVCSLSCPRRGGNETTINNAKGIIKPPGQSLIFLVTGAKNSTTSSCFAESNPVKARIITPRAYHSKIYIRTVPLL
jgi:hypothetical protein